MNNTGTYHLRFNGRRKGGFGISYSLSHTVIASSSDDAREKLLETHEAVYNVEVTYEVGLDGNVK